MAEFRSVGRVQVSLWGRKVGVLVPSPERGYYAFKFDRSFFEPMRGPGGRPTSLDMRGLVEQARKVANGGLANLDEPDALREIIRIGSSAGRAQAKAIVGWNRAAGAFMMGDRDVPTVLPSARGRGY